MTSIKAGIRVIPCQTKRVIADEKTQNGKGKNLEKEHHRTQNLMNASVLPRRGEEEEVVKEAKEEDGVAVAFRAAVPTPHMDIDTAQVGGEKDLFHRKKAKKMKQMEVEKEEKEGSIREKRSEKRKGKRKC